MIAPDKLILLFALYVVAVLVPDYAFFLYWRRLIASGKPAVFPLSLVSLQAAAPTPENLARTAAETIALAPFLEESAFRVAPWVAGGAPLMFAASAAWVFAHVPKVISLNTHLDSKTLRSLTMAYVSALAPAAAFFAYSATVDLLAPYIFHVMHNSFAVANLYADFRRRSKPEKPRFLSEPQEQAAEQAERGGGESKGPHVMDVLVSRVGSFSISPRRLRPEEWVE